MTRNDIVEYYKSRFMKRLRDSRTDSNNYIIDSLVEVIAEEFADVDVRLDALEGN